MNSVCTCTSLSSKELLSSCCVVLWPIHRHISATAAVRDAGSNNVVLPGVAGTEGSPCHEAPCDHGSASLTSSRTVLRRGFR